MTTALNREEITARYLAACRAELQALKPGNVHRHSAGHGMSVETFERAAAASAPAIADPALKVGERILAATEASFAATSLNTNLGIVLLCAPLAKAAAECEFGVGLRRRLDAILARLDEDDADKAFAAIRLANPAGLGKVDEGDVSVSGPKMTLIAAMRLAADRDRIANSYITAFSDIFDFALPFYGEALRVCASSDLAASALHMALLAEFPDSHISRKWGPEKAREIQAEAQKLAAAWAPAEIHKSFSQLMDFDRSLKDRGLNPGTTADFVVATLFAHGLSKRT